MNAVQVSQLMVVMTTAWSSFQVDELKVRLWAEMLRDIRPEVAVLALQVLVARKTFPPSVAEFLHAVWEIQTPAGERLDEGTAWKLVNEGIDDALVSQQRSFAAFNRLPPRVLEVVKQLGFPEIVNSSLDVTRAHFLRLYETRMRCEQDQAVLPARLRDAIADLASGEEPKGLPDGFGIMLGQQGIPEGKEKVAQGAAGPA